MNPLSAFFGKTAFGCLVPVLLLFACTAGRPGHPLLDPEPWASYERMTPITVYGPRDLYQYMNGEAEVYLPRGFRLLFTATYRPPGTEALIAVEAFDMAAPSGAEAMLKRYSRGSGRPVVDLGEAAWTDGSVVLFVREDFFVRVWSAPETPVPPSLEETRNLARRVDEALTA